MKSYVEMSELIWKALKTVVVSLVKTYFYRVKLLLVIRLP